MIDRLSYGGGGIGGYGIDDPLFYGNEGGEMVGMDENGLTAIQPQPDTDRYQDGANNIIMDKVDEFYDNPPQREPN